MTQKFDIAALRKKAQEATPGPWKIDRHLGVIVGPRGGPITGEANLTLITTADPTTILALLDRLEQAEKDSVRLDWLGQDDGRFYNLDRIAAIVGTGFLTGSLAAQQKHTALREAIDAAMQGEGA